MVRETASPLRAGVTVLLAGLAGMSLVNTAAAQGPSVKDTLRFTPVHEPVDYETPDPSEYSKCEVDVERDGDRSGWIVKGPAGQVLRRFVDTNGDNVVDQWRYYNGGIEVYRDLDTDFNNNVDQSRWLNTGGTAWGVDENEDGHIDRWKILSAEEASREAARALKQGDPALLEPLLISRDDIRQLGIDQGLAEKLLEAVANPGEKMRSATSGSRVVTSQTEWMRFDSSQPGLIPSESGKAQRDLRVYENAMAIVQTGGEPGLVQLGEMVRVGDVWKLTQIPQPLEGNSIEVTAGGILMQPELASASSGSDDAPAGDVSPEMQKLLEQLRELDRNSPSPSDGRRALADYNSRRADLLAKLAGLANTPEQRREWKRQMVDGLAAAVQTGAYPEGLSRLKEIEADAGKGSGNTDLLAYVTYRRMLAEYSVKLEEASGDERGDVQKWWLDTLRSYVERFSGAKDAADALLQLAITLEFSGKLSEARQRYSQLAEDHPDTDAGKRAAGALRRLNLEGQTLSLSGSGLDGRNVDIRDMRGRVVLVIYWATWCKPCTEDLPQVRSLYQQHRGKGFEILGVNLDSDTGPVRPYMEKHGISWPQIHSPGGLQSEPARAFGIISLPTMFLVDRNGTVLSRNVSLPDLKERLPKLLEQGGNR